MDLAEDVYDSMLGERISPIPGVPNAFAEGADCAGWNSEIMEAYERLRIRLGIMDEDEDLEAIVDCFLLIQRRLCINMFRMGAIMGSAVFPDLK